MSRNAASEFDATPITTSHHTSSAHLTEESFPVNVQVCCNCVQFILAKLKELASS